ncbi:hypothetical protein [Clostridium sp.]|uniref:hypothetical protein n=1 Tax=Clostridium sp. TaxID=1506 RepID=UPI002FC60FAC
MKMIKYKLSIIILLFLCSSTLIVNNRLVFKINEQIFKEDMTVNVKPKIKYTLYDALNEIYKYDMLVIEKINLEEKNTCHFEIIYNGDISILDDILQKLSKIQQVSEISNISINKNENNARFSVKFMLYK